MRKPNLAKIQKPRTHLFSIQPKRGGPFYVTRPAAAPASQGGFEWGDCRRKPQQAYTTRHTVAAIACSLSAARNHSSPPPCHACRRAPPTPSPTTRMSLLLLCFLRLGVLCLPSSAELLVSCPPVITHCRFNGVSPAIQEVTRPGLGISGFGGRDLSH